MRIASLILTLITSFPLLAQEDHAVERLKADSLNCIYIGTCRDYFTLYAFSARYSNGILFSGNRILNYFPISPLNFGIGFSHKWLSGSISLISATLERGKFLDAYNFNIHVNAYARSLGGDVLYSLNQGYYAANYKRFYDLNPENTERPYFKMRMERITVNAVRIFNGKNYSLSAPVAQDDIQKRNSSSFLLNASISLAFTKNGDSTFVPTYLKPTFANNRLLHFAELYSISLMPGYGITWVLMKRFYIGLAPSIGPSLQFQHLGLEGEIKDQFKLSYKILGRFGAGFHAERWVIGLSVIIDTENYPLGANTNILNNVGKYILRFGYKFNVPKWGRKYSDYLDKVQHQIEKRIPSSFH